MHKFNTEYNPEKNHVDTTGWNAGVNQELLSVDKTGGVTRLNPRKNVIYNKAWSIGIKYLVWCVGALVRRRCF